MFKHIYILLLFTCLLIQPTVYAVNVYRYQDNNGQTLYSDKIQNNPEYKKISITYYPDSNIHHYNNWGKTESSVLPSFSKNKNAFDSIISHASQKHNVPEGLIKAIMHTESSFNIHAKSSVGAEGLMQLMPATAKHLNVLNTYNPEENIHAGAKYLAALLKQFNGDTRLALAAYNAGAGNVNKYGGIPPFKETRNYVERVLSRYNNLYLQKLELTTPLQKNSQILSDASKSKIQSTTKKEKIIQTADGTFTNIYVTP